MRHLKPISKADMSWSDNGILETLRQILSFLAGIVPVVDLIAGLKGEGDPEEGED